MREVGPVNNPNTLSYCWYYCDVAGLQVQDDVDQLLMSEGFEVHSDDDRLQHLLSLHQLTKVYCLLLLCGVNQDSATWFIILL